MIGQRRDTRTFPETKTAIALRKAPRVVAGQVRVMLVDDHPIVRAGMRTLLERDAQIVVVAEADNGQEALDLVHAVAQDVILVDMEMPGMNGVQLMQRFLKDGLQARVLVLSAYDEQRYIQEVLSVGAAGYLIKDEAPDLIIDAVLGVARGEGGWISRKVASHLSTFMREESLNRNNLTRREMEVLQCVVNGKTNQEIGAALSVSEKTIEKHLFSIMNKLGVSTRVEAAVLAVRSGWVG